MGQAVRDAIREVGTRGSDREQAAGSSSAADAGSEPPAVPTAAPTAATSAAASASDASLSTMAARANAPDTAPVAPSGPAVRTRKLDMEAVTRYVKNGVEMTIKLVMYDLGGQVWRLRVRCDG